MDILIEQEIALHQYEVRQNKLEVMRLLHPSFREVGKSGNSYDYQSTVEMMEHEKPSKGYIHSQEYECIQVELSVQLLLYKSAFVDEYGEESNFAKRSSIWIFTGACWQMKYHQGTLCKPFGLEGRVCNNSSNLLG
jgi:hypothetical protein